MIPGLDFRGLQSLRRFVRRFSPDPWSPRRHDQAWRGHPLKDDAGMQQTQVKTDEKDVSWSDTENIHFRRVARPPARSESTLPATPRTLWHPPTRPRLATQRPGTGGLYFMGEYKVYLRTAPCV